MVFGHEFSGTVDDIGEHVADQFPHLEAGMRVTVNPLLSCRQCRYCLSGKQNLCPDRLLLSAHLPGSNSEFVTVRADAIYPISDDIPLDIASLTEPAACAIHAIRLIRPQVQEKALVVGAGPIGIFVIQALIQAGIKDICVAELNTQRRAMAESIGATAVILDEQYANTVDIAFDAVGIAATRQTCLTATRAGGRVVWLGLHEATSQIDINDTIRREILSLGSFAYTPVDFKDALHALSVGDLYMEKAWTRVAPLDDGTVCFQELLDGSSMSKIWLQP
jgi:2-desacetyl-2-hydroxyethyl bacteriochlorophyllide A dehydrogenase